MNKIFILLLVSFSLGFGFKIEQEFNIKTVNVVSKNISNYKEFYAKITPDRSKVYDINMRFDGFITKLYADKDFAFIKKGDPIFDIYSKEIYNLYDELRIAKKSGKSIYNSVKNKFTLYNITPNKTSDNSTKIKSPYTGYITEHNINKGSFIKKGQKIFTLTDLNRVWGIIKVYQKDIEFVKKGMDVQISVDGLDKTYKTKIDHIYPNIDPKDQTLSVRVELENKELNLLPNMFAKAKIFESEQNILIIPKNALIQRDGKQYVFFKEGKEYTPSEVTAKPVIDGYKIIEGLEEGDVIVKNALFLLDSDAVTNGLYNDDW